MGKITVNPGNIRNDAPPGEHITRIMYSDTEPPKNYIWGKPDDCYYTWNGCEWVLLNSGRNSCHCSDSGTESYIKRSELQRLLKQQKLDIIAYLKAYVNNTSCGGGGSESTIQDLYFKLGLLESDVTILNAIDHNSFATKTELQDAIAGAGADVIDDVKEDIRKKEKVTAAALNDLNSRINELSNSSSTLIPEFRELESETLNIKNNLDEIEEVVAESLNDLNSRIRPFENNSHITTLEVGEV